MTTTRFSETDIRSAAEKLEIHYIAISQVNGRDGVYYSIDFLSAFPNPSVSVTPETVSMFDGWNHETLDIAAADVYAACATVGTPIQWGVTQKTKLADVPASVLAAMVIATIHHNNRIPAGAILNSADIFGHPGDVQ